MDLGNSKWNGASTEKMKNWIKTLSSKKQDTVLVFSCGLHDIVRTSDSVDCQVGEEDYRNNLQEIIDIGKNIFSQIVFCSSIPIDDERHNGMSVDWYRYNNDICRYNEIAMNVCVENNIGVIDLYGLTKGLLNTNTDVYIDHIHVNEYVSKLYATEIVNRLTKWGYFND